MTFKFITNIFLLKIPIQINKKVSLIKTQIKCNFQVRSKILLSNNILTARQMRDGMGSFLLGT